MTGAPGEGDSLAIREATEGDIPSIQDVAREAWRFAYERIIPPHIQDRALASWYSDESLARQIPAETNLLLVAEAHDLVGFAQFVKLPDGRGQLARIYVRPAHHRKGAGSALLEEGLRWLERIGVRRLSVDVEELNPIGRAFYDRTGFEETARSEQDLFGHGLSIVTYERDVR